LIDLVLMKKLAYILFFLPVVLCAQYDFETRYFKIDDTSLPMVPEISSLEAKFSTPKNFEIKSLSDFNKVTAKNYWEAVDMSIALEKKENYKRAEFNAKALQQKFSAYGGTSQYSSDGATTVVNTVYKEQRGLYMMDACPPFGICPRCAAFRVGRGY
jgi:hypothetical protein